MEGQNAEASIIADPDPTLQKLERIVEVAREANKPLHRNEMRVDWAQSLGAGERRYIEGLRGTLEHLAVVAEELIKEHNDACSCIPEPGTDPACPVHQSQPEDEDNTGESEDENGSEAT